MRSSRVWINLIWGQSNYGGGGGVVKIFGLPPSYHWTALLKWIQLFAYNGRVPEFSIFHTHKTNIPVKEILKTQKNTFFSKMTMKGISFYYKWNCIFVTINSEKIFLSITLIQTELLILENGICYLIKWKTLLDPVNGKPSFHNMIISYSPCFFGKSTVNLCRTSRVFPDSVPNKAPLPSITMNPNLLSSASSAVSACKKTVMGESESDQLWKRIRYWSYLY